MAKKRKVRTSEAEATPEAAVEQREPTPPPVQEPQTMAVDESAAAEAEQAQDDEEEEAQEDGNGEEQSGDAAGNGGAADYAENNGKEDDDEEDDDFEDEPVEKILEPFTKDQLVALLRRAVEKHPDMIEDVREFADEDPAHRKIFVHGLGWDATVENLHSVFGKYGEIEDCKHVTDRVSGKSKGYAFILYKHRIAARKALKQPQKKVGNRTTSCQLASTGPVPAPPPTGPPPVSEYTLRKIFVSNVSAEVDPGRLLEFFKQFGEIEEGPLGIDKQTGKPKGFALFVYKSVESAKRALEEPHKNFEGYTLHCQKAIDGPKHGKPSYGGHQQSQQYNQPTYHSHRKDRSKYVGGGGVPGHMMTPPGPAVGYSPVAAPGINPALGQALTALLTTQGGGMGFGNFMGGMGAPPMNQGVMPSGYGAQGVGYGMQPGMQPGYQNPPMGQGNAPRPPQGGPPYMGH